MKPDEIGMMMLFFLECDEHFANLDVMKQQAEEMLAMTQFLLAPTS